MPIVTTIGADIAGRAQRQVVHPFLCRMHAANVPCRHRPVTHRLSASSDIGSGQGQSSSTDMTAPARGRTSILGDVIIAAILGAFLVLCSLAIERVTGDTKPAGLREHPQEVLKEHRKKW